jgi:hypothetical protein
MASSLPCPVCLPGGTHMSEVHSNGRADSWAAYKGPSRMQVLCCQLEMSSLHSSHTRSLRGPAGAAQSLSWRLCFTAWSVVAHCCRLVPISGNASRFPLTLPDCGPPACCCSADLQSSTSSSHQISTSTQRSRGTTTPSTPPAQAGVSHTARICRCGWLWMT